MSNDGEIVVGAPVVSAPTARITGCQNTKPAIVVTNNRPTRIQVMSQCRARREVLNPAPDAILFNGPTIIRCVWMSFQS